MGRVKRSRMSYLLLPSHKEVVPVQSLGPERENRGKIPAVPSCPPVTRARARGEAARSILEIAALSKGGFYF